MDLKQAAMLCKRKLREIGVRPISISSPSENSPRAGWLKGAALILAAAAVGLPINDLAAYALLLALAVIVFTGEMTARLKPWLAAIAFVAIALAAQIWLSPPRLEEGHNVFLPGAQGEVLRRGLPPEVFARLAAAFDANYPAAVRCLPGSTGCWQDEGAPDSLYAFSADGIWRKSEASRAVSALDFPIRSGCISASSTSGVTIG